MDSPEMRHELRTPVNLIIGYCEILLGPESDVRKSVPFPYREQVEGIYRNVQQLQTLIENLISTPTSVQPQREPAPTSDSEVAFSPKRPIVLLDEQGTLDSSQMSASPQSIIEVQSVEEIGRLGKEIKPAAILVNKPDSYDVLAIAQLIGKQVPIVVFDLSQVTRLRSAQNFMMKPVQFETLSSVLHEFSPSSNRVLIIDDNLDSASMMAHMVRALPEHPQVWNAYSGREALALLRERISPDVIILDFVLPDMNGLLLLDYLQSDSSTSQIPVLLVSAHRLQEVIETPKVTRLTIYSLSGITLTSVLKCTQSLIMGSVASSQI